MVTLAFWSAVLSLASACSARNDSRLPVAADSSPRPARLALATSRAQPMRTLVAHSADEFVNSIGLNTHLSYFRTTYGTGWADITRPKLIALGVRHLRDAATVLPSDGWMKTVYGRMNDLAASGIHFVLYARLPKQDEQGTIAGFSRLLDFGLPAIEGFEGLNEHDLTKRAGWIDEVRTTQQALYSAAKGDPRTRDMPVYGPSFGRAGNAPAVGALSQWMDFGNIHPYPGGLMPLSNIRDHETKVRSLMGAHPMVVTETGYHTALQWKGEHPGVSEQAMGRYVPRLFLDYYAAGIERTYLYEFIDEGTDPAQREQNFGLLRADGSEKPAYTSLKNLIGILKDPGPAFAPGQLEYSVEGDTTGVNVMLFQKRDRRFYLAVWQEVPSYDQGAKLEARVDDRSLRLRLAQPAHLKVYLPVKGAEPALDLEGTTVELQVPDSPVIVEVTP